MVDPESSKGLQPAEAPNPIRQDVTLSKDQRYYVIPSVAKPLPRVSTILDCYPHPGIQVWRDKVGNEEADRISKVSTDFGSRVHKVCEDIDLGRPYDVTDDVEPYARSWRSWKAAKVQEIIYVEHFVWSTVYGFAGTIDRVVRMKDGRTLVLDLKTSKSLGRTYDLQCIAYRVALKEREGISCHGSIIVDMPSDKPGMLGTKEPRTSPSEDWHVFRGLVDTFYDWRDHELDWQRKPKLEPWGIAA